MLKKFSAVAVPFVGPLVTFTLIAMGMCYHNVIGTIRTAFINRNYMINMIIHWIERYIAPIAFTLLAFILGGYIFYGMNAYCTLDFCMALPSPYGVFAFIGEIVAFIVVALIFAALISMSGSTFSLSILNNLTVLLVVLPGFFEIVIALLFIGAMFTFPDFFWISISISLILYMFAVSANSIKAIAVFLVAIKLIQEKEFGADRTLLENRRVIKHSILVNAISHIVGGQSGTSAAFSGATLDPLYYTARLML